MKVEFYQLTWGPRDWYWRVTLGHVEAAGRHVSPAQAAADLAKGILWAQHKVLNTATAADRVLVFMPGEAHA